jgi:hypothetical protein
MKDTEPNKRAAPNAGGLLALATRRLLTTRIGERER